MADDIVSFGMEIDSSAARKAKQDLSALAQSGPAVEQALNRLKGAGASGAAGVGLSLRPPGRSRGICLLPVDRQ